MKKTLLLVTILILLVFFACSCTAGANSAKYEEDPYYDLSESTAVAEDTADAEPSGIASGSFNSIIIANSDAKLIYSATYYISTKNFDDDLADIISSTAKYNGYIASEESSGTRAEQYGDSGRYSDITIKIPIDSYAAFTSELSGIGTITNKHQSVDNITEQYIDIEGRISLLETRYKKLEEHLNSASQMQDIIDLEKEMSEILYELEALQGEKRGYDNLISYSTINIILTEVISSSDITISNENFFDKASEGFMNTLYGIGSFFEGLGVFLISAFPVLLILALAGTAVILIIKLIKKQRIKRVSLKKSLMEEKLIEIDKIEKTNDGILRIYTTKKSFPLIYRSAMAIYWDEENSCIYHVKCSECTCEQWYTQILRALLNEYGSKLLISPNTKWEGLNESERSRIIGAEQYVYSAK